MDKNQPLISVIVPVYNTAAYLARCVNSLLEQTYKNLEIILVDDGSTDGSGEICDKFAQMHPHIIKVIHQTNTGPSGARNAGLDIMRGEWFSFADSDDFIDVKMYEKLISAATLHNMLLVSGRFIELKTDGENISRILSEKPATLTYKETLNYKYRHKPPINLFAIFTYLFHKNLVNNNGTINYLRFNPAISIGEDTLFMHQILYKAGRLLYIPEAVYMYNRRNDSITKRRRYEDMMTGFAARKEIIGMISRIDPACGRIEKRDYTRDALNRILKIYKQDLQKERIYIRELQKHILRYGLNYLLYGKDSPINRIKYLIFFSLPGKDWKFKLAKKIL